MVAPTSASDQDMPVRVAPIPAYSPVFFSYSPLIQSRPSYPPTMRPGGEPPPKCKTPPDNSTTTIPLCHAGKSVADQEQKQKQRKNRKDKRKIQSKHHPVGTHPQYATFVICPCCQEIHTVGCSRAIGVLAEARMMALQAGSLRPWCHMAAKSETVVERVVQREAPRKIFDRPRCWRERADPA